MFLLYYKEQATSKFAITALINMCEDASVLTDMTHDELIDKLMENLMVYSFFLNSMISQESDYPLINLNLMLLANVSTVKN